MFEQKINSGCFYMKDEDEEEFGMSEKLPKMGTKKRLKMEMKAEKRAMREVCFFTSDGICIAQSLKGPSYSIRRF